MTLKYFILSFILFSPSLMAQNPLLFNPDFSGKPLFIPQGANIMPLCSDPSNPNCFSQWTHQAIPLASYFPNLNLPQYNYFLPSFIPIGLAESPENNEEWEEIYIPSLPRSSRKRRDSSKEDSNEAKVETSIKPQTKSDTGIEDSTKDSVTADAKKDQKLKQRFYRRKSQPNQVRAVTTDDNGKTTVQEGKIAFINADDIEKTDEPKKQQTPASDNQKTDQEPAPVEDNSKEDEIDKKSTLAPKDQKTESPQAPSSATARRAVYKTARDTQALPAGTKEIKQGCIVIDKQETETEAGFCFECSASEVSLDSSLVQTLNNYIQDVNNTSRTRIQSKIVGRSSDVEKICSPETSLKAIIDNFNRTCPAPYKDNFESFFKKVHCKACQKGAPVELMMAMMSIESAGLCSAEADSQVENSAGLFQVNGRVHQCTKRHKIGARRNIQCLKNPDNNLRKSLEILTAEYSNMNKSSLQQSCSENWIDMNKKERDSWRKAVAAYNAGLGCPREVLRLAGGRTNPKTVEWEKMRAYYFIGLFKGIRYCSTGGSISNIAHTEAILGREVKNSPPGIIEFWSQYKKEYSKNRSLTCP